ncbi:MAG TPA: hypothetical protein VGN16_19150, partial [Acidobacteriaceae bacterium]
MKLRLIYCFIAVLTFFYAGILHAQVRVLSQFTYMSDGKVHATCQTSADAGTVTRAQYEFSASCWLSKNGNPTGDTCYSGGHSPVNQGPIVGGLFNMKPNPNSGGCSLADFTPEPGARYVLHGGHYVWPAPNALPAAPC